MGGPRTQGIESRRGVTVNPHLHAARVLIDIAAELMADGGTKEHVDAGSRLLARAASEAREGAFTIGAAPASNGGERKSTLQAPEPEYLDRIEEGEFEAALCESDLQKWRAFAYAWGFRRRRCSDMREEMHAVLSLLTEGRGGL